MGSAWLRGYMDKKKRADLDGPLSRFNRGRILSYACFRVMTHSLTRTIEMVAPFLRVTVNEPLSAS